MKSPRSISLPQLLAAVTTLAVAWLVTPLPVLAQSYQTIDPPGSTYTIAQSINDKGQIVGFYLDSNRTEHGFLYNKGTYTTIDPPGSVETDATDINSLGQIVGTYSGGGFFYSQGTYTTIEPPGSNSPNYINGYLHINKAGQIVGTVRDVTTGVDHGFLYSASAGYTVLDFPDASDPEAIATYPLSINDAGQVVGGYLDNNGHGGAMHGFLYSQGSYTKIEPPGTLNSIIQSINKFGAVVGQVVPSSGGPGQGFVYTNGTFTILEFPGAVSTQPISINDKGQVTGFYQTSGTTDIQHAFVYSNGQYTSIDPPAGTSPIAFSINNSGQIVGYYWADNTDHGFLATLPKK